MEYHTQEVQRAVALMIDGSALQADTVWEPEERCFTFYKQIIASAPAHPLFLSPPTPPSGEHAHLSTSRLLETPVFFRSFLSAALCASALGQIALILPSVRDISDIRRTRGMIASVTDELYRREIAVDETVPLCICLDTREALTSSRELLEEADLLVVDTTAISHTVTGLMPSLELIETAIGNAHVLNRFAAVGGTLTADPRALPHLFAMGVDALIRPFSNLVEISNKIHTKNTCK